MKNGKLFSLIAMTLAASANGGMLFYRHTGNGMNPDYRRSKVVRKEREFDINGERIMAYSRKDAIKRLKARKSR